MDIPAITRLATSDPSVVSGLIEEHVAARLAEAGPQPHMQAHNIVRWRGVGEALEAASQGTTPLQRLDRPPRWLAGAASAALQQAATSWFGDQNAMSVRILERLGLVDLVRDDTYVLAFVAGIVGDPRFAAMTRTDVLRADPELREAIIWRLFEVEGGGEVSLANLDKFTGEPQRWSTTFHELVDNGTLERSDVLTAALGALARDFSAYRAGWYSRLYRSFDPTSQEGADRQPMLRQLLRSEITATVTMALRQLLDVARAEQLDDEETARSLGPAFRHESKTTVDLSLRLSEGIAQRRPDLGGIIADQVVVALAHRHPQVQERAGRLLLALGADRLLDCHRREVAPGVANALGLAGHARQPVGEATPDRVGSAPVPADAPTRHEIRPAAGAELVEIMAALLEDASDPTTIERALAGLALAGQTDALASLVKRATTVLERGPREAVTRGWLRGQLAQLVLRSTGQQLPALAWQWDRGSEAEPQHVALRFLARRIDEVGSIVAGQARPGALAATPEHPAGWIRPETLVARVLDGSPMTYDLVGALLRLAPQGRQDGLALLDRHAPSSTVPRIVHRVLRHALGDTPPTPRLRFLERPDLAARAWWTAAARARDPFGTDPWVERLGLVGAGRAQALTLRLGVPQPWIEGTDIRDRHMPWVVVESPVGELRDSEPTAVADSPRLPFGSSEAEEFVPWAATVYPADAEHLAWVAGIDVVTRAMPYSEVRHDAVRVLDALGDHEGRVGRLTGAVLVAGLGAVGVDERVRAVDAVTRLAANKRLNAVDVATGLLDVGPLTLLPRLAGSLRDVAAVSPSAGDLVIDALTSALPGVPAATRGVHALLEVLLDELILRGSPTPKEMKPWLAQFRGTSRTADLAARLAARA